jgi:hypothetical protein
LPYPRDEHSAIVYEDSIIIFGGFSFGKRTNDLFKYDIKNNEWVKL